VKSVEQRSYTQGAQSASITLYRLRDPSSAYGAYTFLRDDGLAAADLGSYASASQERALIVVGEMLLDVSAAAKQARPSDADLKQLADLLDKKSGPLPLSIHWRASSGKGARAGLGALRDRPAQLGTFRATWHG
jgi:hypothetical protein